MYTPSKVILFFSHQHNIQFKIMEPLEENSSTIFHNCRTCLNNVKAGTVHHQLSELTCIFNSSKTLMSLAEIVMACTSVSIVKNDGLPYHICNFCKQSAINALNFKLTCEKVDTSLRNKLYQINNVINPAADLGCESTIKEETKDVKRECTLKLSAARKRKRAVRERICSKCDCCGKTFKSAIDLDSHIVKCALASISKTETDIKSELCCDAVRESTFKKMDKFKSEKTYLTKCEKCLRVFTNTKIRYNHQRKCNQENLLVFSCNCCKMDFGDKAECEAHIKNLHSESNIKSIAVEIEKCDVCLSKFDRQEIDWLVLHRASEHKKEKTTLVCEICSARLASPASLIQHVNIHEGFQLICHVCGKTMKSKKTYASHLCLQPANSNKSEKQKYNCLNCGKTYTIQKYLKRHVCAAKNLRRTLKELEPKFVCGLCNIKFESLIAHNKHAKEVHTDVAEELFLKEKEILKRLPANSYRCDICDKNFSHKLTLKCHVNNIHNGNETSFLCPECGKSFKKRGSLLAHGRTHVKDLPYECKVCNKRYKYKAIYNIHLRSHTGEKTHKCLVCGKSFRWSGGLIVHLRRHQGIRPYECTVCGKSFVEKGGLTVHSKIHTGETRFECPVCKKRFYFMKTMKKHLTTHR